MKIAIHWFRRDLRLRDNAALAAAAKEAGVVAPVYILSDWQGRHRWTGPHRQQLLCDSLRDLSASLHEAGSRLIIRQGDALGELERLVVELKAEAIFYHRDPDPFGRQVEEKLAARAKQWGISLHAYTDFALHARDEVLTKTGGPFRVFTPFAKAWSKLEKPEPSKSRLKLHVPPHAKSLRLPSLSTWDLPHKDQVVEGGETAARARWKKFLAHGVARYGETRNDLLEGGTSRLSHDLRFGLLSLREIHADCAKLEQEPAERSGARTFIRELVWREFCMNILWHFPHVLKEDFNPAYHALQWPGSTKDFHRWRDAETGYPLIDAAMRQLAATGFLANRTRMIVAMFLTKDLHVHWKEGERYFMEQLVDGEIASNNTNWQWCAGTGADAAPYFRIQNPWTQAARFDPEAKFIKHWLPELRDVPTKRLINPTKNGERVAAKYPAPMVEHGEERERTLRLFKAARKG